MSPWRSWCKLDFTLYQQEIMTGFFMGQHGRTMNKDSRHKRRRSAEPRSPGSCCSLILAFHPRQVSSAWNQCCLLQQPVDNWENLAGNKHHGRTIQPFDSFFTPKSTYVFIIFFHEPWEVPSHAAPSLKGNLAK